MTKFNRIGLKGLLLIAVAALVVVTCAPASQAPAAAPAPAAPGAPKAPAPAAAPAPAVAPQPAAPAPAPAAAPAPAPAPASPKSNTPSGTLTVAVSNLGSEDWLLRQQGGSEQANVTQPIGDPLYGTNRKDNTQFDPKEGILDSWKVEVKGDDVTTTFVLKRGVPWHNNEGVVTTQDLKFTEEHMLLGGVSSSNVQRPSIYNRDIKNVEIVDDVTMRYHSKLNWVFIKFYTSLGAYMMPKAYIERVGEAAYNKKPVNTGPFKMVEHISDTRVTLEAVPNHYRKTSEYAKLVILKVPERSTRLAMLLAGQIAITDIAPLQAALVEKNPKFWIKKQPGPTVNYFLGSLNNKYTWEGGPEGKMTNTPAPGYDPKIPWVGNDYLAPDKVKVRLAMDIAIDRQAIADQMYLGYAVPIVQFQWFNWGKDTPGSLWYGRWPIRPYDPKKAKQLLTEAGYPNGFSMNAWLTEAQDPQEVMTALAGFWEKNLSLKVNVKRAQYNPTVRQNFITRTYGDYAMITNIGSITTGPSYALKDYCGWCTIAYFEHPIMDDLMRQNLGELDVDKANAIQTKIGDLIYNNAILQAVVLVQVLSGLDKSYVKEWNKSESATNMVGLEYVVKP